MLFLFVVVLQYSSTIVFRDFLSLVTSYGEVDRYF